MSFDAKAEAERLKSHTKIIRKPRFSRSRLDRYAGELLELRKNGVSVAELQRWLRAKRIKVNWTTVKRWLDKHG